MPASLTRPSKQLRLSLGRRLLCCSSAASMPPSPRASAPVPGPHQDLKELQSRAVGAMLGKFCGDVLGAAVEGSMVRAIYRQFPDGLTDFQTTARGYGHYTDDTQMAIALARSLLRCGRSDPDDMAAAYAAEFQPHRGYGGTAVKVLQDLTLGADWRSLGTKYFKEGSLGNGGAMRIAPIGIAYRNAPPEVLRQAVWDAVRCTHVHPQGVDGAVVQAAAVAWFCRGSAGPLAPSPASAATPPGAIDSTQQEADPRLALLDHLASVAQTEVMRGKLQFVRDVVAQHPMSELKQPGTAWGTYFSGPVWDAELEAVQNVAEMFQIQAPDAVACALLALCFHWGCLEDAVVAAVHYGGDTDTIAAMVGAMAGAQLGRGQLPARWVDHLENGEAGRDEVERLAQGLAGLDCRA